MKITLQVGDKVYYKESYGKFSRYHILTVISVKDKIAEMDNAASFVRECIKLPNIPEYFIEYSSTRKSPVKRWFLCDDKILTDVK